MILNEPCMLGTFTCALGTWKSSKF